MIVPETQEKAVLNPTAPCMQPPPPVSWHDYKGPFAKTVAVFGQRLERKSVRPPGQPHYKPGVLLGTLEPKDKFFLFVRDSIDPVTFLSAGFNAGIDQAQNDQPSWGQGMEGYSKRFAANMAGQATGEFFKEFLYPTIFSEDPRYYRLGSGSVKRRVFHAIGHQVLGHNENGRYMFNFSEWFGGVSAVLVSNTYLPDEPRGVGPTAQRVALGVASDAEWDILREFWPEIAKKFHLPFRDESDTTVAASPHH